MATDDACQCSDGGQFFNPENWTTSEACHRCGKPARTTLSFPSRSVPVGTGELEKLLDKVSEEKGEGAVRAARAQLERLQNHRCQRQECAREREAVDRLEQQVQELQAARDSADVDFSKLCTAIADGAALPGCRSAGGIVIAAHIRKQMDTIKKLVDVLEEAHTRKTTVAVWMEDGREVSLQEQINEALRKAKALL